MYSAFLHHSASTTVTTKVQDTGMMFYIDSIRSIQFGLDKIRRGGGGGGYANIKLLLYFYHTKKG